MKGASICIHNFILFLVFVVISQPSQAQDSHIAIEPAGLMGEWIAEGITYNKDSIRFVKGIGSPGFKRVDLKLNRYKEFHQFLIDSFTEKELNIIDNYLAENTDSLILKDTCRALFDIVFLYHKNGGRKYYKFRIYDECPIENVHYGRVYKIIEFWKQFLKEHECEEPYSIHKVQPKETVYSICKKYGIDDFTLGLFVGEYYDVFKKINQRKFNVFNIIEGKEKLQPDDKLIIPCFPVKKSLYE